MGYDAFISYSHSADGRLAPALQTGLQRLARPWYRMRALRVFRDETGLAVNPHLWASIQSALDESRFFILLASPAAAASPWVNRELEHFLETEPAERVLPVLTEGDLVWARERGDFDTERSSALPPALVGRYHEEPKHLDLRWARDETELDLHHAGFRTAVAGVAAPIHGIARDELESEDVHQYRRRLRLVWGAGLGLLLLTMVSLVSAGLAVSYASTARANEQRAVVQQARAERNASEASSQRTRAEDNARRAQEQKNAADTSATLAEQNAAEAEDQRSRAEQNAAEAAANAEEAATNGARAEEKAAEAAANADEAQRNASAAQESAEQASVNAAEAERNALTARENEAQARTNAQRAQQQQAVAEQNARVALSRQLAAQALDQINDHLDLGLLLAANAWRVEPTPAARNALLTVTQEASRGLIGYLRLPPEPLRQNGSGPVAMSTDGRYVAKRGTASEFQSRVYLWDRAASPPTVTAFDPPTAERLAFVGNDALIGVGGNGFAAPTGAAFRHDLRTGETTSASLGCVGVCEPAITGRFAMVEAQPGIVRFVDTATMEVQDRAGRLASSASRDCATAPPTAPRLPVDASADTCFSADRRFVLGRSATNDAVIVWDLAGGATPVALAGPGGPVDVAAFDPSGQVLAGAEADGTIMLFDPTSGLPIPGLPIEAAAPVEALAAGSNGTTVAALDAQGLTIGDASTGSRRTIALDGLVPGTNAVALSPTAGVAVAQTDRASSAPGLVVVDTTTGRVIVRTSGSGVSFSREERGMVVARSRALHDGVASEVYEVWDLIRGVLTRSETQEGSSGASLSPDGHRFATLDEAGVHVWDLDDPESRPSRLPGSGAVTDAWSLVFSATGSELVGALDDGTVVAWDPGAPKLGSLVATFPENLCPPVCGPISAVSPDGHTTAQVDRESGGVVRLTDTTTGRVDDRSVPGLSTVASLTFTPDGRSLVFDERHVYSINSATVRTSPERILGISGDGRVMMTGVAGSARIAVRRASDFAPVREFEAAEVGPFTRLTVDRTGTRVAAFDGLDARTWDVATGRESLLRIPRRTDLALRGGAIALSPDGSRVAAASAVGDGLLVWDTRTNGVVGSLPGDFGRIAFSPDGTLLAAGDHLWDADTLEPVGRIVLPEGRVLFTTDGTGLLIVGSTELGLAEVRRLVIDPAALLDEACRLAGRDLTDDEARRYGLAGTRGCSA